VRAIRSSVSRSASASATSRNSKYSSSEARRDQLGRGRRGRRGEIVLLDQQHFQAPAGGIARDTRAVDAAADDQKIVMLGVHAGVDSMSTSERILRESERAGGREAGMRALRSRRSCLRIRTVQRTVLIPLIVACSLFMENMDSTVIATSLPAIAADIGESPLALKLALTSYLVGLAVFIPISGWVADRLGSRTVFASAIVVFVAGSLLCAVSGTLVAFVAARFLQGIGGAMMVPVGRLVLLRAVPKDEAPRRAQTTSHPGAAGSGHRAGARRAITLYFSWRWIFLINLPIGVLGCTSFFAISRM